MTYNPGIPLSTDYVGASQQPILDNFNQLNVQFAVDHTAFNTGSGNGDGFHKKVTLVSKAAPGAQTDPSSVLYSASGTASTVAQLFYRNQNAIYQVSPIKAWAFCNGTSGGITSSQSSNVTSFTRNSTGQYTVVLPANAVSSANYVVICTTSQASSGGSPDQISVTYTIVSATSFTLKVVNVANNVVIDVTSLGFMVLQI